MWPCGASLQSLSSQLIITSELNECALDSEVQKSENFEKLNPEKGNVQRIEYSRFCAVSRSLLKVKKIYDIDCVMQKVRFSLSLIPPIETRVQTTVWWI